VLNPTAKMSCFKKQWPEHLHNNVLSCAKGVVSHLPLFIFNLIQIHIKLKACHSKLNAAMSLSSSSEPTTRKSKAGALKKLIQEVLSDSNDNNLSNTAIPSVRDPLRPWRAEFLSYLETIEAVPPARMSTIQWWSVSILLLL
jgi:hypothetical protein